MPEKLIHKNTQGVLLEFSGSFETRVNGISYGLELCLNKDKSVMGKLLISGESFDIKGHLMVRPDGAYGFLLEPFGTQPMALLRAGLRAQQLILEVDFPNEGINLEPQRLIFRRKAQ